MENSTQFYSNLPVGGNSIAKAIRKESNFQPMPTDWHVVVADVQHSTEAVEKGFHNEVNLAATGSVVTVMNTIKSKLQDFDTPYFFGGDGVTFLIHQDQVDDVITALENYRHHVHDNLSLALRVGSLSIEKVLKAGHILNISKVKLNQYLTIPIILGNGVKYAERFIKDNFEPITAKKPVLNKVDLTGMECRWDEIAPRDDKNQVVCLLVHCEDEQQQAKTYGDILDIITLVFGNLEERQPITVSRLKLKATIAKIKKEMTARIGKSKLTYLYKHFLITYLGQFYFRYFKEGKNYLSKVSQLSDTIMFDGSMNMIMEGDPEQVASLTSYLDLLEREGKIKYGVHITHASVMSCYVQDRGDNHIHFVDGTDGGYTSAAIVFKSKMLLDILGSDKNWSDAGFDESGASGIIIA